jgi:hypothetical protein
MTDENEFEFPLQEGWQGGPASLVLELDELELDDGSAGPGVIFQVETPCDIDSEGQFGLGCGELQLPKGKGHLKFWVAASMEQAARIRDGLATMIDQAGTPATVEVVDEDD